MATSFRRCVRGFLVGGSDPRAVEVAEEGVGDDMDEDPDEDPEDGSLFIRSILPPACA